MDPAEYDGLYNINFGGTVNVLSFVIGVRKSVSLQWCPRGFVLCLLQIWVLVSVFPSNVTKTKITFGFLYQKKPEFYPESLL